MAYTMMLKCSNCGCSSCSADIPGGTTVADWLATPGNNTCAECGCATLVKE